MNRSGVPGLCAGLALVTGLAACGGGDTPAGTAGAAADGGGSFPAADGATGAAEGGAPSPGNDGSTPAAAQDAAGNGGNGGNGGDAGTDGADTGTRSDAATDAGSDTALPGYTLSWSDEFNGPDGSAADPAKWGYDTGGGGWGNAELETYTSGTENAVVGGGLLTITAKSSCQGATCSYTSARLLTKGKFAQAYGHFVARIQIPSGQGIWPAFWMLGNDIDQVSWPKCGEIDIMENIGKEPTKVHGSLHGPSYDPTGTSTLGGSSSKFADAFHTFAVDWDQTSIRFYVDDVLYETQNRPAAGWPFAHPFFLILNVAVGGTWPGNPDKTSTFPQTMKVDWVRAYTKNP